MKILTIFFLFLVVFSEGLIAQTRSNSQDSICSLLRGSTWHSAPTWENIPFFRTLSVECYQNKDQQLFLRGVFFNRVETSTIAEEGFWSMEEETYFTASHEPTLFFGKKWLFKFIYLQALAGWVGLEKHEVYYPRKNYTLGDNSYNTDIKVKSSVPSHFAVGGGIGAFYKWKDFEFAIEIMKDIGLYNNKLQIDDYQTSADVSPKDQSQHIKYLTLYDISARSYLNISIGFAF